MVPPTATQGPTKAPGRPAQPPRPSWSQRHWARVLSSFKHKHMHKEADAARMHRRLLSKAREDAAVRLVDSGISNAPADTPAMLNTQGTPDVVYEKLLHDSFQQRALVAAQDLTRMDVVAARLLQLSGELDADVSMVARMVWKEGSLLLLQPKELHGRIKAVAQSLAVSESEALTIASRDPRLLLRPAAVLLKHLATSAAILKLRGLPALSELAARQPAILRGNSPAALAAKVDALRPALGGVSAEVVQAVLTACPGLLRRSPQAVHKRYMGLVSLLPGLPPDIIADLIMAAPDLLNMSTNTLNAKFRTLLTKYGAFRDDVVDVVLVDPMTLLNAEPTWGNTGSTTIRTTGSKAIKTGSTSVRVGNSSSGSTVTSGSSRVSVNSGSTSITGNGRPAQHVDNANNSHAGTNSIGSNQDRSMGVDSQGITTQPAVPLSSAAPAEQLSCSTSSAASVPGLPVVGQLITWASAVGVPLYDVLQLYARTAPQAPSTHSTMSPGLASPPDTFSQPLHQQQTSSDLVVRDASGKVLKFNSLPRQLQIVAAALGLTLQQAKLVVGRAPGVLAVSKKELRARVAALADVIATSTSSHARDRDRTTLQVEQSQSSSQHVRAAPQRQPAVSIEVQALLLQQPELLLQPAGETAACIAVLQQQLGLDATRGLRLLQQQPRLLLLPPSQLQTQLQDLQVALGGVSTRMLGELVLKEPNLLGTPCHVVSSRYAEISASFGSFNDDALGVVLADPSILLRPAALDGSSAGRHPSSLAAHGLAKQRAGGVRQRHGQHENSPQLTGQGGRGSSEAESSNAAAAAAAALDAMVKAESETARRVQPSRSKKRQAGQQAAGGDVNAL